MPLTRPPVLPVWADTGDKTQPSDAELSVGWPVTSIPPSRQRFNWFQNFVANGIRYFARRGLSDYSATETYEIGDRCIGDDGKTYKSLVAANINFAPSTNPLKWERWGFSLAELYAFLLSNHGGNCPVTGPASSPSAVSPWTRYTSVTPYFEEWEYFPSGWRVVANYYGSANIAAASGALVGGSNLVLSTPMPRAGKVFVHAYSSIPAATAATHTVLVGVGAAIYTGTRSVETSGVEPISTMGITVVIASAGQNLDLYAYPALAGAPSHGSFVKYQYVG